MRKKRSTVGVLYLRGISPPVKDLFKSTCVRRGETMSAVVEALMRAYIADPTPYRVRRPNGEE